MAQQIEQLVPAPDQRPRMSYEEFLAWTDEDTQAEWVDGEVIIATPPKLLHQELLLFLGGLVNRYARLLGLGKAGVAPFEMIISSAKASRQPDIFFVRREHLGRLNTTVPIVLMGRLARVAPFAPGVSHAGPIIHARQHHRSQWRSSCQTT